LIRAGLVDGMRVLDAGCGTGAIYREASSIVGITGFVAGVDPSMGMLREHLARSAATRPAPYLVRGLAEALPFANASFDFICMGYALRHVSDLFMTLQEYGRVLRPGGRLVLLEFNRPRHRIVSTFLRLFLSTIVAAAARFRSGKHDAQTLMRYCWDTVEGSISPTSVLAALSQSGFVETRTAQEYVALRNYTAIKPAAVNYPTR
jgi:demethylmenaquinone methyltransferase/2-methoxy-6-polyprenyl-1,4-benzoquinol methylase